ncbi:MAG: hypothetical protein AAFQ17_03550, partial [Pseudomonadota bacterium]
MDEKWVEEKWPEPAESVRIHEYIMDCVHQLRAMYFHAIRDSLPADEKEANRVSLPERLSFEMYAKCVFWDGVSGQPSAFLSGTREMKRALQTQLLAHLNETRDVMQE